MKKKDHQTGKEKRSFPFPLQKQTFEKLDFLLFGGHLLTLGLYFVLTKNAPSGHSLLAPIDASIPLLPWTVFIYHLWYPTILCFFAVLLLRDRPRYRRTLTAMILVYLLSFVAFLLLPTDIPRPAVTGTDLASRLLTLTFQMDQPTCGFPSLHVGSMVVVMISSFLGKNRWRWLLILWCVFISLTTLTTKQHVFYDLPGGLAFGSLAWLLSAPLRRRLDPAGQRCKTDRQAR